jgi:hypothetical protein
MALLVPWASLALGPRWEPLMLQRSPMGNNPRPRRSQYTFFLWAAVALWCWSSWRSLCGAGGRDGSKVAPGASRRSARNAGDCYAEQSEPNQTERGFRVVEHS